MKYLPLLALLLMPVAAQAGCLNDGCHVVSVNNQRNSWGIVTKMVLDTGGGADNHIEYANAIAWTGFRWIREDATHITNTFGGGAPNAVQNVLITAVKKAKAYEGAPVRIDEEPVVDQDGPSCPNGVTPSTPYCGVVQNTQYEWDYLAQNGVNQHWEEGLNEPNNFGFTYLGNLCGLNNGGTYAPCVAAMEAIYAMAKADSNLSAYPIFGMTNPGLEPDASGAPNAVGLAFDGFTFHPYYDTPTVGNGQLRIDNQVWDSEQMTPNADGANTWGEYEGDSQNNFFTLSGAEAITVHDTIGQFAGPSKLISETGLNVYHCSGCTTRWTQGLGAIDAYLDASVSGIKYISEYEMMERSGDSGWGFFYPNPAVDNVSFNPSIMASETGCCTSQGIPASGLFMHNLTSILADTVSITPTMPTGYSVTGGAATTHTMLGQYSASGLLPNGYVTELWDEQFTSPTNPSVTVNFGSVVPTATVYDTYNGVATPDAVYNNVSSVTVTVGGESPAVMVVW